MVNKNTKIKYEKGVKLNPIQYQPLNSFKQTQKKPIKQVQKKNRFHK